MTRFGQQLAFRFEPIGVGIPGKIEAASAF
jgi:hypothetical protein